MMPAQPRHIPVNLHKHLKAAVHAHGKIKDGIAWHAKMEAAKRAKEAERMQANAGIVPKPPAHGT